jgi:hypothetical protein
MGPTVSASPSICTDHSYKPSVTNTPSLVFTGKGNLFGFIAEANASEDQYILFYDAAAAVDVTVGTTTPVFTFRIPSGAVMGKDVNDSPIHYFAKGCVVAISKARATDVAPTSGATCQFWSSNQKY